MAYQKVNPKPVFPEIDQQVIDLWKREKIFEKTSAKAAPKGSFVFFEGPPTANGKPGIHHVLSRVFKDIIPRYKTMQGYKVDRKGGWDTHGLPVELEVEKNLGISGKPEIEKYGIEKFNKKCRESVWKYVKDWEELTERIGFWVNLENAYVTYDASYIESLWWVLGEAWKKELLYEGHKVVPYCPRCGTALSSHEVAQGYKDVTEKTVYVKFPVKDEAKTYFLAWTTTPWTLPGNTGLALGPKIEYVKVESDGERFILAKERLEQVFEGKKYTIIDTAIGKEIVEILEEKFLATNKFSSLFEDGLAFRQQADTDEYKLILGDFVSTEDGTGIVHIAPAFGEDDYNVGRLENNLSVLMTIDENGKVRTEVGKGKFAKDADADIITELEKRGLVFKTEDYEHAYPYCWRCGTALLYYARDTWFIKMSLLRDQLVENNEKIHWHPLNVKHGRFGEWIKEAKDWALSRERYWGTPLPIWKCKSCGKQDLVSSYVELEKKVGKKLPSDFDPHRPYIDEYKWDCECGGQYERVPYVLDCWFDSGAMPYAQWHYPYGKNSKENFESHFPAAYICEAVDQTRGWFYTLHAISTLLGFGPAYLNVVSLGHILDEEGQKMSKSKGNVVNPWDVLKVHGADAVRWYMYSATTAGNPRNFSIKLVGEGKRFLVTLWNVYSFFVTYANVDNYSFNPDKVDQPKNVLDRWILSRKNEMVKKVTIDLDRYNIYAATVEIERFLDDLSNWYVRRSRKRFWKSENDTDKKGAYDTLYIVLKDFVKVLSPFMPFLTENIYGNLTGEESVHLAAWPEVVESEIDKELEKIMEKSRGLVEMGLSKRNEAGIKVRQPLDELRYLGERLSEDLEAVIAEEVNVKKVSNDQRLTEPIHLTTEITPALKREGLARDLVRSIQEMRKKAGYNVDDRITISFEENSKVDDLLKYEGDYIKKETLALQATPGDTDMADYKEEVRIEEEKVMFGVKKARG